MYFSDFKLEAVNTVKRFFQISAFHTLSLLHFPLLHFPPRRSTPAFSTPAFSTPAFSAPAFKPRTNRFVTVGIALQINRHFLTKSNFSARAEEEKTCLGGYIGSAAHPHDIIAFEVHVETP